MTGVTCNVGLKKPPKVDVEVIPSVVEARRGIVELTDLTPRGPKDKRYVCEFILTNGDKCNRACSDKGDGVKHVKKFHPKVREPLTVLRKIVPLLAERRRIEEGGSSAQSSGGAPSSATLVARRPAACVPNADTPQAEDVQSSAGAGSSGDGVMRRPASPISGSVQDPFLRVPD